MELPSLTSSGSVQSHMSVSISKKRLRLHSSHSDAWEPPLPVTTPRRNRRFSDLLGYCDGWNAAVWVWCSLSNVYLRWLLLMYMGFSLVFISVSLYAYLDDILAPNPIQEDWFISSSQRLSRMISYYPTPTDFEPFVLRGTRPDNLHAPTACCSCTDAIDITLLMNWTRQWNGPISIVMTTTNSSAHTSLLNRLEPLKIFPLLSLHLLPEQNVSPNIILNLARFFALTSHVVLFPGELPSVLAVDVNAAATQYITQNGHIPAILTGKSDLRFPLSPLSPMILSQDYPVWCPERFFFSHSRSLDWEECLDPEASISTSCINSQKQKQTNLSIPCRNLRLGSKATSDPGFHKQDGEKTPSMDQGLLPAGWYN
ncbi:hypothetical protein CPB85DRAFT_1429285 [Mucidula mucida]|nr:hypothetical protein CPB85DRAFT_1429285 [Mucidula mucida]